MHHCLCIPEIVAHICDQSDESIPRKRRLSTIVALAQTCRAFYEPATSHLWYDIDTLIPLVRCMPDDLWAFSNTPEEALIFKRAILPTDWPRFKEHAQRVRRFGCQLLIRDIDLSVSAYETLHIAAGGQVLLPHLKQLIWTRSSADGVFPYISLFMAPDLRTFHLKSSRKSPIFSTLIASLSTRYPFLSDVNITLPIESNITSILSTTVCGWDRLRHLSISSLSKEALIHVATLSELRRFSLEHQGQVEFPTAWSNTTFPALTHLSSSLRNINITDDDYEGMLDGEDHEEHLMIKGDRIRLLLAFAHLTRLHLYSRYGFDLDDTLIGDVARALPCLQQLSIWGGPDEGRMPRTTIACLRELAQHCKHLWRITMAFDARLVSNLKTSQRVYAARLTMLDVIGSPISDSAQVAAFLSDIFPSLRTVLNYKTLYRIHDDVTDFDLHKKWSEVESLVRVYAVVPAQETARRKPDDSDDE